MIGKIVGNVLSPEPPVPGLKPMQMPLHSPVGSAVHPLPQSSPLTGATSPLSPTTGVHAPSTINSGHVPNSSLTPGALHTQPVSALDAPSSAPLSGSLTSGGTGHAGQVGTGDLPDIIVTPPTPTETTSPHSLSNAGQGTTSGIEFGFEPSTGTHEIQGQFDGALSGQHGAVVGSLNEDGLHAAGGSADRILDVGVPENGQMDEDYYEVPRSQEAHIYDEIEDTGYPDTPPLPTSPIPSSPPAGFGGAVGLDAETGSLEQQAENSNPSRGGDLASDILKGVATGLASGSVSAVGFIGYHVIQGSQGDDEGHRQEGGDASDSDTGGGGSDDLPSDWGNIDTGAVPSHGSSTEPLADLGHVLP